MTKTDWEKEHEKKRGGKMTKSQSEGKKIIIETRDDISIDTAMGYVSIVMSKGRISESHGIKHYCWVCIFEGGIAVAVRQKKNEKSADSFIVYKDEYAK